MSGRGHPQKYAAGKVESIVIYAPPDVCDRIFTESSGRRRQIRQLARQQLATAPIQSIEIPAPRKTQREHAFCRFGQLGQA
ncbi:MAG: hypothetical protein MPJ22_08515, partial [Pirellulales bacterium]|nr:hypothetical protein [Pirellulales bacterium]